MLFVGLVRITFSAFFKPYIVLKAANATSITAVLQCLLRNMTLYFTVNTRPFKKDAWIHWQLLRARSTARKHRWASRGWASNQHNLACTVRSHAGERAADCRTCLEFSSCCRWIGDKAHWWRSGALAVQAGRLLTAYRSAGKFGVSDTCGCSAVSQRLAFIERTTCVPSCLLIDKHNTVGVVPQSAILPWPCVRTALVRRWSLVLDL